MKKNYEELDVRPYSLTEAFVKKEGSINSVFSISSSFATELEEKRKNLTPEQIHEFCSCIDHFCKLAYLSEQGDFMDFINGKNDSWLDRTVSGFFLGYLMDNSLAADILAS